MEKRLTAAREAKSLPFPDKPFVYQCRDIIQRYREKVGDDHAGRILCQFAGRGANDKLEQLLAIAYDLTIGGPVPPSTIHQTTEANPHLCTL